MASTSIQFTGKEKVLDAYRARAIDAWSVWQGKDLLFVGSGAPMLSETLVSINGTNGAYQLRVHDGVEDANDITSGTPFNGSFRFRLDGSPVPGHNGYNNQMAGPQIGGGVMAKIYERIEMKTAEKFEKLLEKLDEDEDDKPKTIGGVFMGVLDKILENPVQIPAIIQGFAQMMGRGGPVPAVQVAGTIPQQPQQPQQSEDDIEDGLTEKELEILYAAYITLKKSDQNILQHLQKLADLSEKNPQMFTMLISSLDNIKV